MYETLLQRLRSHVATAGQAIVEFALAATLIFFLLAAAVDLGLIFFTLQGLNNAAQEGAAFGARWLAIQEDNTQPNFGDQIVNQNEIRNRVRFESGTGGGINAVNLFDLDNDDVPDVTDDMGDPVRLGLDGVPYSYDTSPNGGAVYTDYIRINMLGYWDQDGDGSPELGVDDDCLGQTVSTGRRHPCFLQVAVSYEYDLVFGLAPAFGDRVRLTQSHTERIVDPLEKLGEVIPGQEPVFWTATATNTPSPTNTPTETPSPTSSPTVGPSPTETTTPPIITSTPTETHTPGPSPTATNTHTPGPSPTATDTPTNTPTPTPTPSLFIAWVDPDEERADPEDVVYWAEGDVKDVRTADDTYFRVVAYGFNAEDDLSGMTEHQKDGTNIDRVEFEIRGPADDRGPGEQVLWRADGAPWGPEGRAGFCVFGGNTPCNRLNEAPDGRNEVPDWRSFFNGPGEYTLRSRAYSDGGVRTQWVERKINVLAAEDMAVWITNLDGDLLDEDKSDQTVPEVDTQDQTGFRAVAYRKDGDSTDYDLGRDGTDVDRVEVEILRVGNFTVEQVQNGEYAGTTRFFPRRKDGTADYHFFSTDNHLMSDYDFSRLDTGIYILRARTLGSNSFLWSEWTETLVQVPPIDLYIEFIDPVPPSSNPRASESENPDLETAIAETKVISTLQDTQFRAIAYDLSEYDPADTLEQRIAKDGTNISQVQFELNAPQDFPFRNAVTDYKKAFCTEGPTGADLETGFCYTMSLRDFERLNVINGIYTIRARARLEGGNRWSDWEYTYFNVPAPDPCQDGSTPLPIALEAGWTADDIGVVNEPGLSTFSGDPANGTPGSAEICSSGGNIWDADDPKDNFHFVYTEETAELKSVVARMDSFDGSGHRYTRTGLMLRASSDPNAAHVMLRYMPNENGGRGRTGIQWRENYDGGMRSTGDYDGVPTWMKLERSGGQVIAYFSRSTTTDINSVSWIRVGDADVDLGDTFLVGIANTARDNQTFARAGYSNIEFEYIEACSTNPSTGVGSDPSTGWVATNIGTVSDSSVQFTGDPVNGTPGSATICTTGESVWGKNDDFQFVYTEADSMFKEVTARLHDWSGSADENAKTGLMVRSSTAENASYFMVRVKIEGNVATQYRHNDGNKTIGGGSWAQSYPTWLRIVRDARSNTFTGYYSLDTTTNKDEVTWTELETQDISDFGDTYLVGIGSSGYNNTDFTRGQYEQIEIGYHDVCDITCCPELTTGVDDGSGWQTVKIGDASFSTPFEVQRSGGAFDMCYIGENIWNNNEDHFPFTYQEIDPKDFSRITVRLDDVRGSDHTWARVGPMVRDTLDQNAANFMARYVVNQDRFTSQYRPSAGANSEFGTYVDDTAPLWMRIEKVSLKGDDLELSWHYSYDGSNWTQGADGDGNPTTTITLSDKNTLYVGLATTSRDGVTESWATFSNVTIE